MLLITFLLGIIVVVSILFFGRFSLVRIQGTSMEPTFYQGQIKLIDEHTVQELKRTPYVRRADLLPLTNRIFTINPYGEEEKTAIKRLMAFEQTGYTPQDISFFFLGDNAETSYDSRDYGSLTIEQIEGEIVTVKEALTRFFKP